MQFELPSSVEWMRLTKSGKNDLSGTGGRHDLEITLKERKCRKRRKGAWIAING